MRELQTGVWHWEAPHPEWENRLVSSYAIGVDERVLFFDPLAVPSEIEELADGRENAVVLTSPWHRRDGIPLAERLGAPIYVPHPDPPDPEPVQGNIYKAGDRLPVGVEAFPGRESNDPLLWIESRRALVAGDTLIDRGSGLEFPLDWVPEGDSPEQLLEAIQPVLELPVELVLPTHGAPTDRIALERALS